MEHNGEHSDELDAFLASLGGTPEQIAEAWRQGRPVGLASDLVLAHGAHFDALDLASRAGTDVEEILMLWRTLGINVVNEAEPLFNEDDAKFTDFAVHIRPVGSHGDELFRVVGSALAHVAEAAISLYVQTVQPIMDTPEVDLMVWAKDMADTTTSALLLGEALGSIFAHHIREAITRQRIAQADTPELSLFRLAVGFVDLVGFTPLSRHVSPPELLDVVGGFEARAFEVATAHRGRIVKHIGDEVMFVALSAAEACGIAAALTAESDPEIGPRGGIAFGDVISRHGDYYGPVVNLASRLADLAIPKEVLVDRATAEEAGSDFSFQPAGQRLLKGFDEPVEVFSLEGSPAL